MIEYRVTCDGCGKLIGTSTMNVRAARADASLNHGGNHGPDGDRCKECRIRATSLTAEDLERATKAKHSAGPRE